MKLAMPVLTRPVTENFNSSVEAEHHIPWCEFRNLVRLYELNDVPTLLREWPDPEAMILEIFRGNTNRKFKAMFVGGRVLPALKNGGLIDAPIESSPQLIEHFSKLEREGINQLRLMDGFEPNAACSIVIHAYDNIVEFFGPPGFVPEHGNIFSVNLCSPQSFPAALKSQWH
jgi:hypothetical protein